MNRVLVFFLGFIAGSVATMTTILIIVFGYNLLGSNSHHVDYDTDYWLDNEAAADSAVVEVEDYCVVVEDCNVEALDSCSVDSTTIVWTEY